MAAIDAVLDADGFLVSEQYMHHSWWCSVRTTNPPSTARADAFMLDFFRGNSRRYPRGGLWWLLDRKRRRQSSSQISYMFGPGDIFMNKLNPYLFMDRMFWMMQQLFPRLTSTANGGVGSWKWQQGYVTKPLRDNEFVASWQWYCGGQSAHRYLDTNC